MLLLPAIEETVRRFNTACSAYDAAVTASQARDTQAYDGYLIQAAREVGSALEHAVFHRYQSCGLSTSQQGTTPPFPEMIQKLFEVGNLRDAGQLKQNLKRWRDLRNRAEHPPIRVPTVPELLDALRGARDFLIQMFGPLEILADPNRPAIESSQRGGEQISPNLSVASDDQHRELGPERWISERIEDGLRRIGAGNAPTSMRADDVRRSLLRLSHILIETGHKPSCVISTEDLDKHLSKPRRLYLDAGWLMEDEKGSIRFRDPRMPALLQGIELAKRSKSESNRRRILAERCSWTEAAWAATAAGDTPYDWLESLFEENSPEGLLHRLLSVCAALAGLDGTHHRNAGDLMVRAAASAAKALVWFVPPYQPDERTLNPCDAWHLGREVWQRAVLDLAKGTQGLSIVLNELNWRDIDGPLGRLVTAIGIKPRLSENAAQAVMKMCIPWPCKGACPLDDTFYRTVFSLQEDGLGSRTDTHFCEIWMCRVGLPASWQGDKRQEARRMVVHGAGGPAGFLLNCSLLHPEWCKAWAYFAQNDGAEEAASAWVQGITWMSRAGKLADEVKNFLLVDAPTLLREQGMWETGRKKLANELSPKIVPIKPDEEQVQFGARLFQLAEFSPDDWCWHINQWSEEAYLPWRILLEAGAPHESIARWCVDKLKQKEREECYQDGPVGIVASPGVEVLSADGWQLAFNQAHEALEWLLNNGDNRAVKVLADACLRSNRGRNQEEPTHFDPSMGKLAGLTVPLSQVIWGRVLGRRDGRTALYDRVEDGADIESSGGVHFLAGFATVQQLWEAMAGHLCDIPMRNSGTFSPDDANESRRLICAFERWMGDQSHGPWRANPDQPLWADPAMRRTKALIILCGTLYELDVVKPLMVLLQSIVEDAQEREMPLLGLLGLAISRLCGQAGEPLRELLKLASTPVVAARMAQDQTQAFWEALLREMGFDAVTTLLDTLALPDLGLGFFDALVRIAPDALAGFEEREDLLRPVLIRSARAEFRPSAAFYERAWCKPRRAEHIRGLDQLLAGEWLEHLLKLSRGWSREEGMDILQWLTQWSQDVEVRRRCLLELIDRGR